MHSASATHHGEPPEPPTEAPLSTTARATPLPPDASANDPQPRRSAAAAPTLADLIAAGPLDPARALALVGDIADALDAARAGGDDRPPLDPEHVVIDATAAGERARPGLVEPASRAANADRNDSLAGLPYRPPEDVEASAATPRGDVYALAALLYHCLTGSVPFPLGRDRAVLFWHAHAPRPRATSARPSLPPAIDEVLARGMAVDPSARHPTARALIDDARGALPEAAAPGSPSSSVTSPAVPGAATPATATTAPAAADHSGTAAPSRSPGGARARRRGSRAFMWLGLVFVGVAMFAAAFVLAGGLVDAPPPASVATAGSLQLEVPAEWARGMRAEAPADLRLHDVIVLQPPGRSGDRLVAGTAAPAASVALLDRLDADPPAGEPILLGRLRARRYHATRPLAGGAAATVYAVPGNREVAIVACLTRDAAAGGSFARRCEDAVGSVRVNGRRAASIGPTDRQAAGLAREFARLNGARSRYRSRLVAARTAERQATAAETLARAQARAASALQSLRLSGMGAAGGRAAVASLRRGSAADRALARAARRGEGRRYAAARRAALRADATLKRALEALRVAGYVE